MTKTLEGLKIYTSKEEGPTTLIVGLVHGNELVGERVLSYVAKQMQRNQHKGTIMTLVANPKAQQQKVRFINSDLNRSFLEAEDPSDQERIRAHEIMEFFADIKIDNIFDVHSTPSKSDPMILCSAQSISSDRARFFPIKYVVKNLINNVEGVSLLQHFVNKGTSGLAFEAGFHGDEETLERGEAIAQIILDIHNNNQLQTNKNQIFINTTDVIFTSDQKFTFAQDYKGFETIKAGEIRGQDSKKSYSFDTDKIMMIPNIKFLDDLEKKPRTWLVYFGEQEK